MLSLIKQTLKLKKLNASGVAHHALVAVLVVSAFASFGAYQVFKSKAATSDSAPALSAQGLKENGCVPGERKLEGECKPFANVEKIKDDCALYKLPYGEANKRCRTGLCIDGYEKVGPDCVRKKTVPSTPPTTDTDKVTDAMTDKMCKLLGRQPASTTACKRFCAAGAGEMLTKDNTRYCQHAVALNIASDRCKQLNRVWLGIGCARLPGQQDTDNALQCIGEIQEGTQKVNYKYYNANFTPKNGDGTKIDVCEKDKNTANQNEQNGILAGEQVGDTKPDPTTPPSTDNCSQGDTSARCIPQNDDDSDTTGADFRIILFKDKEFKGDKLEATAKLTEAGDVGDLTVKVNGKKLDGVTHLGALPKGWNDQVSSFKVLKGRWMLCEDATYITNCIKPYASDADLGDAKDKQKNINNKISSVRPATHIVLGDTIEDLIPTCLGSGVTYDPQTGKCSDDSAPICPPALNGETPVVKDGECVQATVEPTAVVPVDKDFKGKDGKKKCELLGREWIESGNGEEHGCSIETCKSNKDGRPRTIQTTGDSAEDRQDRTDTVCVNYKHDAPYAVKLDKNSKQSENKCGERGRIWIKEVKLCAQVPNRKDKNQTIVKAEQCKGGKTTYYIFKETAKTDECFNPSYFDQAKGVAKSVGGSLSAALKQGPKAYCKVVKGGKYHWQDGKCVIDRHKCWNGQSLPVGQKCPDKPDGGGQSNGEPGKGEEKAPDGGTWEAFCAKLGRSAVGKSCSSQCINYPEYVRDPDTTYWGYDTCRPHEQVCDMYQGGGKPCGDQSGARKSVRCSSYYTEILTQTDGFVLCPYDQYHVDGEVRNSAGCFADNLGAVTYSKSKTVNFSSDGEKLSAKVCGS